MARKGLNYFYLRDSFPRCITHGIYITMQLVIDLYVKAVDLAKQGEGLSNQDKIILNKFKIK